MKIAIDHSGMAAAVDPGRSAMSQTDFYALLIFLIIIELAIGWWLTSLLQVSGWSRYFWIVGTGIVTSILGFAVRWSLRDVGSQWKRAERLLRGDDPDASVLDLFHAWCVRASLRRQHLDGLTLDRLARVERNFGVMMPRLIIVGPPETRLALTRPRPKHPVSRYRATKKNEVGVAGLLLIIMIFVFPLVLILLLPILIGRALVTRQAVEREPDGNIVYRRGKKRYALHPMTAAAIIYVKNGRTARRPSQLDWRFLMPDGEFCDIRGFDERGTEWEALAGQAARLALSERRSLRKGARSAEQHAKRDSALDDDFRLQNDF